MSSDFRVGDEVVCVDNSIHPTNLDARTYAPIRRLVVGQVYIIREIRESSITPSNIVVAFDEIWLGDQLRFGFKPCRFRKVQKKFTGMSVLTALLVPRELVH